MSLPVTITDNFFVDFGAGFERQIERQHTQNERFDTLEKTLKQPVRYMDPQNDQIREGMIRLSEVK